MASTRWTWKSRRNRTPQWTRLQSQTSKRMSKITTKKRPQPITVEALNEAAGGATSKAPSVIPFSANLARDPLQAVKAAIERSQPCSLLELAEEYLDLPQLDNEKRERLQTKSEIIVLVIEYLGRTLEQHGLGACMLNGSPHLYGGSHWQPISEQECLALLGWLAEFLNCYIVDAKIFSFREKLFKQFTSALAEEADDSAPDRALVNFGNGTLEIKDGVETMRGFCKSDLLNYQLPFDYDTAATCPLFDRYLSRVLPDESSQLVLAEFIGWIFLRGLKLEKVLVLYGDGHNGKSVFFDIVNALLGEANVSNLGLSSLSKLENRFQLGSTLLNFGSEINDRCDADLFKKLASGEPVEARKLYRDIFILRHYARLAFNANVLPRNIEQTTGFFRRFLIIPFMETITEEEKDPDLAMKIIGSELPGVFNWVMRGLKRLNESRKFTQCVAAESALALYRKESDSVAMFLDDAGLVPSVDGRLGKNDLYTEYRSYCQTSGFSPLSKVNFGKRLSCQRHITDSKSGGFRFWHLIRSDDDA